MKFAGSAQRLVGGKVRDKVPGASATTKRRFLCMRFLVCRESV